MSERIITWVTLEELRRITGKDRRTISDRIAGLPFEKKGRSKLYDKTVALQAIMAGANGADESKSKERKLAAEAEKAELLVARLRGELVSVDQMTQAASELVKTLYTRIVRVLPGVVAQKIYGKEPLEIEAILRADLAVVFNELKSLPSNFISVDDEVEDETDSD